MVVSWTGCTSTRAQRSPCPYSACALTSASRASRVTGCSSGLGDRPANGCSGTLGRRRVQRVAPVMAAVRRVSALDRYKR